MKRPFYRLIVPAVFLFSPVVNAQEVAENIEIATDTALDGTPDFMGEDEPERQPGEVPAMFRDDSMLDENRSNQELGINVYTAPSISKIFDQLDNLPAIPEEYVLRNRPEKLPMHAGALALEMGYLLADGFIAVRSGHMNDIKPIALDLSRYGNALGVGDKMNSHSAGLLEHAEKGQLEEFKRILASTQSDVNAELASLRDPDLSHLIALGGWVRALEASAAALCERFDAEKTRAIFYADAPEYFCEVLEGLAPRTARRIEAEKMCALLREVAEMMKLPENEQPTVERVQALRDKVGEISTLAVGKGYEH